MVKRLCAGAAGGTRGGLSAAVVERLCEVFGVLADPSRLKILVALTQQGGTSVSALAKMLAQPESAVSGRLSLLRRAGLVGWDRDRRRRIYRLEPTRACKMLERLFEKLGSEDEQLNF